LMDDSRHFIASAIAIAKRHIDKRRNYEYQ
jgi:hypothetical protein